MRYSFLTDQTVSEFLILFLNLYSYSRVFFKAKVRSDAIAVIPLISLIVSILNIFAWGLTVTEGILLFISFFDVIWNFRALLRLKEKLVVDHYSFLFKFASLFNIIIVLAAGIFIYINRPVKVSLESNKVQKKEYNYSGSFSEGFTLNEEKICVPSATLTCYDPSDFYSNRRITLFFIPEKNTSVRIYEPYLIKLAQKGYTVYAGEFFSSDRKYFNKFLDFRYLRTFAFYTDNLLNKQKFDSIIKKNMYFLSEEYITLYKLASGIRTDGDSIFIGDTTEASCFDLIKNTGTQIALGIDLSKTNGYTTPGFGPVEQSDPVTASFLGLKRDHSLYMSAHLANKTDEQIKKYLSEKSGDIK